ncbi:unnamed protein product [Calicophoron daubneyi]|uniref:Leucine-rich PPR motif-containing protein, mitochondrial n=1 Tax=Calicophoron daubneyi TaxID=300641 RepID=A0AAV2TUL1_CALDB
MLRGLIRSTLFISRSSCARNVVESKNYNRSLRTVQGKSSTARAYVTTTSTSFKREDKEESLAALSEEVKNLGLRRYLNMIRRSSLLMNESEKMERHDLLWKLILSDKDRNIYLANIYLLTRLDCGLSFDPVVILNDLQQAGLRPNVRTYGIFIRQSCLNENMEEVNSHLHSLQNANLQPDGYIFSQILYGYLKAGCPDEVSATQEIMSRLGLWPSQMAYEALLAGYAELGDKAALLNTLNEAWSALTHSKNNGRQRSGFAPFSTSSLVRFYVKLMNAEPSSSPVCTELLSRLPVPIDSTGCVRAREGVKILLANGRVNAAMALFKHADPESADDSYLVSLAMYLTHSGLDPQGVVSFLKVADASGSRLDMLKRRISMDLRKRTSPASDIVGKIQEACALRSPDGIYDAINSSSPDSLPAVYGHAIPQLLRLGVPANVIIERIESKEKRSAAALGCLLGECVPFCETGKKSLADLDAVEKLAEDLEKNGFLPYEGPVSISSSLARQVLMGVTHAKDSFHKTGVEKLCCFLDILPHALSLNQMKSLILQMFAASFGRRNNRSDTESGIKKASETQAIQDLVDACIVKKIRFHSDTWIFYNLESANIPQEKCERLKLSSSIRGEKSRSPSIWRMLHNVLQSGDVDGAISLMQRKLKEPHVADNKSNFPDLVAIACSVNSDQSTVDPESLTIPARDMERLFWASWDARLLKDLRRAVAQVVSTYLKTNDIKGLSSYLRRASKHSEVLQENLLNENCMRALLRDNFHENLVLLQEMISNQRLSVSTFARAASILEEVIIHNHADQWDGGKLWKQGSPDFWPVQVLAKRFEDTSGLLKSRTILSAIDELCHSSLLHPAHSLRIWAAQLGVHVPPKTNELLILTPYLMGRLETWFPLPQWSMSHDLSQHWPVNLTNRSLSSLDSLILVDHSTDDTGSVEKPPSIDAAANATANWLVKNIPVYSHAELAKNHFHCLPTWLVVCQRLTQAGSLFVSPYSWSKLASVWLTQIGNTHDAVTQVAEWIRFAPTNQYKAALLLSCLDCPKTHDWALTILSNHPNFLCSLVLSESLNYLTGEQKERAVESLRALRKKTQFDLWTALTAEESSADKVKAVISDLPEENWMPELAELVQVKKSLFEKVPSYLESLCPESLPHFYDELFSRLRSDCRHLRFLRSCFTRMVSQGVDVRKLSDVSQALVYVISQITRGPVLDMVGSLRTLQDLYSADLTNKWISKVEDALTSQDYGSLLDLVEELTPELKDRGLQFIIFELAIAGGAERIPRFLLTIAERQNGDLLRRTTVAAQAFISFGLDQAYTALSKEYTCENLNWLDRACIRYQKLGPMMQMKASRPNISVGRMTESSDELTALLKQSTSSLAHAIIRVQSNPNKLNEELAKISPNWSQNRRCSLLSHLAAAGATSAVDSVISLSPAAVRESQELYKISSVIIQEGKNQMENGESQVLASPAVESAVDKLSALGTVDKAYLKGPHVESLFRYWPDKRLKELVDLVIKTNQSEQTSVVLQLAAVLVNRGRLDLADPLIQFSGPIPISFMAGSPRHPIPMTEFQSTLDYLQQRDPDHVPVFVDACLRNSVSAPYPTPDHVANLVRKVTSEPLCMDLSRTCHLSTVQLVEDFVSRCSSLPPEVKNLLDAMISKSSTQRPAAVGEKA